MRLFTPITISPPNLHPAKPIVSRIPAPDADRMRDLVKEHWGDITVDTMKAILSDHDGDPAAICRHGAVDMFSISGYIAEPAKGLLHVRRGLGCTGTWTAYAV